MSRQSPSTKKSPTVAATPGRNAKAREGNRKRRLGGSAGARAVLHWTRGWARLQHGAANRNELLARLEHALAAAVIQILEKRRGVRTQG